MKYLNIALCVLMVLFAAVQYNDPDGVLWAAIYLVPAIWAGIAAFRLDALMKSGTIGLLAVYVIAELSLVFYYWPTTPGFWRMDVWWETETAREGMGVMIAAAAITIVLATVVKSRRNAS
jgi:hypothetical protein